MRWPWSKEEEPVCLEEAPLKSRKKETLSSVSEKLLVRKMKRDPDGFGIEVAMKKMGVSEKQSKSLSQEL